MSLCATNLADLASAIESLRADIRALASTRAKRIEPDAIYSIKEASDLVPLSVWELRAKCSAGIIKARGRYYRIKGSELLKLA